MVVARKLWRRTGGDGYWPGEWLTWSDENKDVVKEK